LAVDHEHLFTSGAYLRDFQPDTEHNPFWRDYAAKRAAILTSVRGQDSRVLDIGGGMGRMAIPLSSRHFVTLCDLSPQMLEQARPYAGERLQLAVADARALPFPDAAFDYALCIDVLPHLPDPNPALREARRVLRPGGTLIVDSSNSVPWWTLAYPRYLGRRPRRWLQIWRAGGVLPEWRTRVWHRRRPLFLSAVTRAGFRIVSVRGFGPVYCRKWHMAIAEAA